MAERLQQLDNRIQITTPENIAFEYRLAGPFYRLGAYAMDLLIQAVTLVALFFACLFAFGSIDLFALGLGMFLICWFVASWFYGGVFEALWNGQTPGKRMMGLRVVTIEGRPINALQAVLRNVLRSVDSLPTFPIFMSAESPGIPLTCYLVGLTSCLLTTRYQRLGDLACGTMVVLEERSRLGHLVRFDDPALLNMAASLPADFVVSRTLGKALAAYVDRRRFMSPARRAEISRHVGEVLVERWNLPPQTSHDLLLCALYHRTFVQQQMLETHDSHLPGAGGPEENVTELSQSDFVFS